MNLDYSKKGIIILSHYRSGGTQLLNILSMVLSDMNIDHDNCGEIEVEADSLDFTEIIKTTYFERPNDKFSLHLLNSPLTISQLHYSGDFVKLNNEYSIVSLERLDKINCLLSLALWERFIQSGLFKNSELWTEENMINFHTSLIQSPIPISEITLGMSDKLYNKDNTIRVLNDKLLAYNNQRCLLSKLKADFTLTGLTYEEYEHDPSTIYKKYFPFLSDSCKSAIDRTYKEKIPYLTKNYIEYYDNQTAQALKIWGIKSH